MKIETDINKVIIYLYHYKLNIDNIDILNKEIKKIFVDLIKKYHFDFFGYSKVSIYNNYKYGNIVEIEKIYNSSFNSDIIELKIVVYKDCLMYLEFDDYYLDIMPSKMINKNQKYIVNIKDIDNVMKYIEYGKISYKNNS